MSIVGTIRINSKNYNDAFINDPDGGPDIYIGGMESRHPALDGDLVKVEINDHSLWKLDGAQKTGRVSELIKRNHSCIAGGFLRPYSQEFALFAPNDSRVPRMLVKLSRCPTDFATQSDRYKSVLFVAQLVSWKPASKYALGHLVKIIGDCNDVQSRIEALLLEHQVFDVDFPPDAYEELAYLKNLPNNWLKKHSKGRRDLTKECIFTIDPKTARDLDDAVSIKQVAEQIYEVGVHIADVSYFVKEMTAVDYYARQRTTSVYLVDRVIPMLPRVLCEEMCSLNPNEPKLTYSVIWKMDKYGHIIDEWFGRTIIKSCVKLAYEEAQDLIDRPNDTSWIQEGSNMPKLYAHDWKHIQKSVVLLNKIAKNMRAKRFEGGALKIEQVKIKFELDSESGFPTGFAFESRSSANYLIEEYMLLANMAVAKRIYKHCPEHAFLRRHPASSIQLLTEVKEFCDAKGYPLDISTAGSLQKSLNSITDPTIAKVVSFMLLRSMKNAEYICTGAMPAGDSSFRHFALNVPFYTHFTSPIRRYADIVVHRQLSLALKYDRSSNEDINSLSQIAAECTKRKIASKLISDTSQRLYFNIFVQKAGFCELLACVTRIYDQSFDVILADYDRPGRVYMKDLSKHLETYVYDNGDGNRRLTLTWKPFDGESCKVDKEKQTAGKKKKKKASKKNITGHEEVSAASRASLETGRVFKSKLPICEVKDNVQIIEVFDVIRVVVTTDKKDISILRIGLKTPSS